jgi:hypothetical protein
MLITSRRKGINMNITTSVAMIPHSSTVRKQLSDSRVAPANHALSHQRRVHVAFIIGSLLTLLCASTLRAQLYASAPTYGCVGSPVTISATAYGHTGEDEVVAVIYANGTSASAPGIGEATVTLTYTPSDAGYPAWYAETYVNGIGDDATNGNITVLGITSVTPDAAFPCYSPTLTITFTAHTTPVDGNPGNCTITWTGATGSGTSATAGPWPTGGGGIHSGTASIGTSSASGSSFVVKLLPVVTVDSGSGTITKVGCTKSWTVTVSGSYIGPLAYKWYDASGSHDASANWSYTFPSTVGTYTPSVTVYDTGTDCNKTVNGATMTSHISPEVTTDVDQIHGMNPWFYVGDFNSDQAGITITFSMSTESSDTSGWSCSISAGDEIKGAVGYTSTHTDGTRITSTAGGTVPAGNPSGTFWSIYAQAAYHLQSGTCKTYNCDGLAEAGTWSWDRPVVNSYGRQTYNIQMQIVH